MRALKEEARERGEQRKSKAYSVKGLPRVFLGDGELRNQFGVPCKEFGDIHTRTNRRVPHFIDMHMLGMI